MNGDTAFHVALTYANLGATKLLLGSGGEVLGSGHQGLTVLMKPLLSEDAAIIHYSHRGEDDRKKADEKVRIFLFRICTGRCVAGWSR
jgi:hypothetical protein